MPFCGEGCGKSFVEKTAAVRVLWRRLLQYEFCGEGCGKSFVWKHDAVRVLFRRTQNYNRTG